MNDRKDRRQFGKEMACLAAGSLIGGAGQASAAQPAQDKPDPQAAILQATMDVFRARYGSHLSDEQLQRVRQKIRAGLFMADVLKRTQLRNDVEPAVVFQADL